MSTTFSSWALAFETLDPYILTMADFLNFVRRRRAELRKELEELDVAERVYRASQEEDAGLLEDELLRRQEPPSAEDMAQVREIFRQAAKDRHERTFQPKTIKQQVITILDEMYPAGLTALEILDRINKRWNAHLERTTLSPQLTRLKRDRAIKNDKTKWYLVVQDNSAPSVSPDGASDIAGTA